MKRLFYKRLGICAVITVIVMLLAVDVWMYLQARTTFFTTAENVMEQMEAKLDGHESDIELVEKLLGGEALDKAKTFSWTLSQEPDLLENASELNKLCEVLGVDELHIINEKGIITHSTIKAYIGFDMASGEQSAAFLKILDDPSLELVQDAQENSADGTLMQYSGVARKDAEGFVQVGMRPMELEEMLSNNTYDEMFMGLLDEEEGIYCYVIDQETGNILHHSDAEMIGKNYQSAGYSSAPGSGKYKKDGNTFYYIQEEYGNTLLGVYMPFAGFWNTIFLPTILISVNVIVLVIILLFMTRHLLEKYILRGFMNIVDTVKKVEAGDYNVRLEEYTSEEFKQLSDGINGMLDEMNRGIREKAKLLEVEKEDAESNRRLITAVKDICESLNVSAIETMNNAESTWRGVEEQKKTVVELENIMNRLVEELRQSSRVSKEISDKTYETVGMMQESHIHMGELESAIVEISEMAMKIEKIISEIDSIAKQTNMLSLNASIEAARAGEQGKGFTVVAVQVGELASRSTLAAQETRELILNSISAVEKGKAISDRTTANYAAMAQEVEKAGGQVEEIAVMAKKNAEIVVDAMEELNRIRQVVEQNVEIAQSNNQISTAMGEEVENLRRVCGVEQ